jgi:hypothetical protein
MLRLVGLLAILAAFGASSAVLVMHVRHDGLRTVIHRLGLRQTGDSAAADELMSAATALDAAQTNGQGFANADFRSFKGLVLAFASNSNYCIQVQKAGKWYHLAGPGGIPAAGTCY